jgi:hypothetical protein
MEQDVLTERPAGQRRNHSERDGAVPAEHQGNVAARQQRMEPIR